MTLSVLRIVWLVLSLALVTMVVLAWSGDAGASAHERYSRDLRLAQELDARLDEEVARSRLGLITHYDDLVRVGDRIRALQRSLEQVPEFVQGVDRAALERRLVRWKDEVEVKQALVESFKTEHSVLRNSVHAFPHNASRLLAALRAEGEERGALSVQELERDLMLLMVAPTRAEAREVREDVEAVRAIASSRPEVATVLLHARLILERQPRVERLVARIIGSPAPLRAEAVIERYQTIHRRAQTASRARWLAVFALALATLGAGAAYIIVRLQRAANALQVTAARLEAALGELEIERDKAQALAQLKSQFVSMTSHEFRTPLSHILSSSELIEAYGDSWPPEKRRLHFGRVQRAAKDMSHMLDQVLLIGRAEAGMLELNPQPLRLRELCGAIVEETRTIAGTTRQIDYVCEAPERDAWLDEKLLRHVLGNLLTNAIKYSPEESPVRLEVSQNGEAALFEVRDRGIGIPPEDRPYLFEAFHRCSNAGVVPGTGLGLAVVKKSLEVHGGSIDVESELGVGTTFRVRVPLSPGEPPVEVTS